MQLRFKLGSLCPPDLWTQSLPPLLALLHSDSSTPSSLFQITFQVADPGALLRDNYGSSRLITCHSECIIRRWTMDPIILSAPTGAFKVVIRYEVKGPDVKLQLCPALPVVSLCCSAAVIGFQ